jgi:hypothetical protein
MFIIAAADGPVNRGADIRQLDALAAHIAGRAQVGFWIAYKAVFALDAGDTCARFTRLGRGLSAGTLQQHESKPANAGLKGLGERPYQ